MLPLISGVKMRVKSTWIVWPTYGSALNTCRRLGDACGTRRRLMMQKVHLQNSEFACGGSDRPCRANFSSSEGRPGASS